MSDRDFFGALRARLAGKPSRDFDAAFWRKFEDRFGGRAPLSARGFPWLSRLVASGALLATLTLAVWLSRPEPKRTVVAEADRNADLFVDVDYWLDFEEVSMSDEQWQAYLEGESRP